MTTFQNFANGLSVSQERRDIVFRMLAHGLRPPEIAHMTCLPEDYINQLRSGGNYLTVQRARHTATELERSGQLGDIRGSRTAASHFNRSSHFNKTSVPNTTTSAAATTSTAADTAAAGNSNSNDNSNDNSNTNNSNNNNNDADDATVDAHDPRLTDGAQGQVSQGWDRADLLETELTPEDEEQYWTMMARLQAHVFRRRVRVSEKFQDFDCLRSGRCTRGEFDRALGALYQPLALNDVVAPVDPELLVKKFIIEDPDRHETQVVDWSAFCETVDEVFNLHALEPYPRTKVPFPGSTVLHTGDFRRRPIEDEKKLLDIMTRIAVLVKIRGICLETCFDHVHRSRADVGNGRIEPRAFLSYFPLCCSTPNKAAVFKHSDLDILIRRYTDENGMMRLHPFKQDIEDLLGKQDEVYCFPSLTTGRISFRRPQPSHESVAGFPLQPPPQSMRPKSASARPYQTQPPAYRAKRRPRPVSANFVRLDGVHVPVPRKRKGTLHERLQRQVITRRLTVYQNFREQDAFRKGVCTICQARTALATLALDLEDEDYAELIERYSDDYGFFKYPQFCADIDPKTPSVLGQAVESTLPRPTPRPKSALTVSSARSARLAATGMSPQQTGPHLSASLPPSAPVVEGWGLRPPTPPEAQKAWTPAGSQAQEMEMGLKEEGMGEQQLGEEDFDREDATQLKKKASPSPPPSASEPDPSPKEQQQPSDTPRRTSPNHQPADGVLFECEQAPEGQLPIACELTSRLPAGSSFKLIGPYTGVGQNSRPKPPKPSLEITLAKLTKDVKCRGLQVLDPFDDIARVRWAAPGHVTSSQYARAMDSLRFNLTEEELLVIFHAFKDNEWGNEFNYVKFADTIDVSRQKLAGAGIRPRRPQCHNPYYDAKGHVRPLHPGVRRPASAPAGRAGVRRTGVGAPYCRPIGMNG